MIDITSINIISAFILHSLYINRYFAICHPLKFFLQSGKRRTIAIVSGIWFICLVPSLIWGTFSKVYFKLYWYSLKLDKYPWHKNRQYKSNTITGWASELQSMDWFKSPAFKWRRKSLRWQGKHESSRISNVLGKPKNTYFSSIFTGKLKYLSTWHLAERIPYIILFTSKYYKTLTNIFVFAFI